MIYRKEPSRNLKFCKEQSKTDPKIHAGIISTIINEKPTAKSNQKSFPPLNANPSSLNKLNRYLPPIKKPQVEICR